jgi:uncharacterized protein (TIGR02118 family)
VYKVIWLVRFRQDVPRDEVLRWWRGQHAEIAASTPGMVRYVQNHWSAPLDPATHEPQHGEQPAFDGHAEHWFADRESYARAMRSDEWRRTQEDGPAGFDGTTLVGGLLEERVITWQAAPDGRPA